jgi:hypothetical protein
VSTYRVKASTDLGRWGVTIVREGEAGGDCFETCNGRHGGDELVAVIVNGDQALAERICALLNADQARIDSDGFCDGVACTHGAAQ